jgi:nucleotide-binding universal stress UspA family protein
MKKILIAIDNNPTAGKVAETGYAIAKAMNAKVTIVHVITEPAYTILEKLPFPGHYRSNSGAITPVKDSKEEAESFLAASVQHLGDPKIETMVLKGETANSILKYSEDWKADLIIMGSHRHHRFDKLLFTYVAEHLLMNSKIPLLTIPAEG